MHSLIFGVIVACVLVTAAVIVNYQIAVRANEASSVNIWFSERLVVSPPQPLPPKYAAVIRSIMDDDTDLWWHLDHDRTGVEHALYHQPTVDFGRYLYAFGPLDAYLPRYCPSIYYGVFETNVGPQFKVWIEFRYQGETVWVLTEENDAYKIVRFSDFRVNHPGCVHRHPIYFVHDGLDCNVSD